MFLDDLRPEAVPSATTGVTGGADQLSDGVEIDDEECEFLSVNSASAAKYVNWEGGGLNGCCRWVTLTLTITINHNHCQLHSASDPSVPGGLTSAVSIMPSTGVLMRTSLHDLTGV